MEMLRGVQFFEHIASNGYHLTEKKCHFFAKQILQATEYIHKNRIIHLDLKPENIILVQKNHYYDMCSNHGKELDNSPLVCQVEHLKIIDFGCAQVLETSSRILIANVCGTLEFISPEVLKCEYATFASDMWSVGVLFYMLISGGLSPFWAGDMVKSKELICRNEFANGGFSHENFKHISAKAISCISSLLKSDPGILYIV